MYRTILLEVSDGVATVTLNRPEALNAYTPEMGEEIVDAFVRVRADDAVRVLILTGAGRGFCAGVDLAVLKQSQTGEDAAGGAVPKLGEEAFIRTFPLELAAYPKPVIAAINGAAIGVGVTMTLPCDIRLAADTAKLGLTFTKLGLLPGLGSTHLLPGLVGMAKALELVLTARVIDAAEAAAIGLVNRVVPATTLKEAVRALAIELSRYDANALAAAKRLVRQGAGVSLAEAMRNELAESAALRDKRARRG
ncbi:MAG: enoyl-CoA hydratase [Deltaproteobacteria bacterium]|nr:enoyl-CoA hydratase [Deltaproteobacteria bacterium]